MRSAGASFAAGQSEHSRLSRALVLNRTKPIIGLIGTVGAGKTTVARMFESLGAVVIDSDRDAHRELETPEVVAILRSWWGDSVAADGRTVDRSAIGEIVFSSPEQLERLESLLYPRLARLRDAVIAQSMSDDAVRAVVLDSPKLLEAGLDRLCDAIVVVDADRRVRLERVANSRDWSEEEVSRREKSQFSLDEKKAKADYIIINNADTEALRPQVEQVFDEILSTYPR